MSRVAEFHRTAGQPCPDTPPLRPWIEDINLRHRLIKQEFDEVIEELEVLRRLIRLDATPEAFLAAYRRLLKELCDLDYVVEGTAVALGLSMEAGRELVHQSNMGKLRTSIIVDSIGKVLKPPTYEPPDMTKAVPDFVLPD